jgi:hypothetical protein
MRSLAAAVILAASLLLPASAVSVPVTQAATTCTGWASTITPPSTIRVLRSSGVIETVDFKYYVKIVMPAEWSDTWPMELLRAGAIAVKQYAWKQAMSPRSQNGACFDVYDNTNDQMYDPQHFYPNASHTYAVDDTWSESILKNGSFPLTQYWLSRDKTWTWRPCGYDADGQRLYQVSARQCADDGKTSEEILQLYYGPGVTFQGLPTPYPATTYHALNPTRILDTRDPKSQLTGTFSSHVARTFQVRGNGGVPDKAIAVTGNLTVTEATLQGYLYIGPIAMDNPTSSTLNFPTGDDRANAVSVALSAAGTLSVTYAAPAYGPTAHVIFDVTGYYAPDETGATFMPLTPTRLLDTRVTGYELTGSFTSHVARTLHVTGVAGVPSNAIAITGNLTVTQATSGGFLYIGPTAMNDPTSSNLNFPRGDDRANAVTVTLGTGDALGTLSITYAAPPATPTPTAHVILDVTGYYLPNATGSWYVPMAPFRLMDSRDGPGQLRGQFQYRVPRTFRVVGHAFIPATAVGVTGNLTVTQQTSFGFLYLGPDSIDWPTSSTLNFPLNDDRANAVVVALSPTGYLWVTSVAIRSHVIFDVTGYFAPPPTS